MSSTPDYILLQQYFEGKLNPEEMHQLEKQALDDPFLSEAMDGYAFSEGAHKDLSLLQKQLQERVAQQAETKRVYAISWQRLSIAAVAAVMFVSAGILFWMKSNQNNQQLANNTEKRVDVELPPNTSTSPPDANVADNTKSGNIESTSQERQAAVRAERNNRFRKSVDKEFQKVAAEQQALLAEKKTNEARAKSEVSSALNEVVVTGYPTQEKSSLTGAVSKVASADGNKTDHALQGKLAGLSVVNANEFKGKITDKNGEILAGVSVRIKGKDTGVASDKSGEFTIALDKKEELILSYIGFEQKEIKVRPGDTETIVMDESSQALSEVVTIGYGATAKSAIKYSPAEPVEGYDKYYDYLRDEADKPKDISAKKGRVIVSFKVSENGSLSDFKIVKSLDDASNAEAIRIIKDGPKWKPASDGKPQLVKMQVRFK